MNELRLKRAQYLFGTLCSVELTGPSQSELHAAMEASFAELTRNQRLMSPFDPQSELSRLNASAGRGPCAVSQELCALIEQAVAMSEATSGRYDLSMWPLLELWRGCEERQRVPRPDELEAVLARVDYRQVHVDRARSTVSLSQPTTRIDLSSVVKGHALDCALAAARRCAIHQAVMNAGGEILVWRHDQDAVEVGLADPTDRTRVLGRIRLTNQAVATSAQGEVRLIIDGQPIGHLFDLTTGWPMETEVLSVSVVAPSGLLADLLSTAIFVVSGAPSKPSSAGRARPSVRGIAPRSPAWSAFARRHSSLVPATDLWRGHRARFGMPTCRSPKDSRPAGGGMTEQMGIENGEVLLQCGSGVETLWVFAEHGARRWRMTAGCPFVPFEEMAEVA